ncbi:MAG: alpha/beta fold hydrolase [Myxococcota bacterium]
MLLAIHGLPTSPALWSRLPFPVDAPLLPGVDTDEPFSLDALVAHLRPRVRGDTVLVGHDLGGVVAAMLGAETGAPVVLTGTALGPYWAMVRATARWPLHRYFYERHAGRKFLAGSVSPARAAEAMAAFSPVPPARMRAIARAMRPPAIPRLRDVRLVWGRDDRWYPPFVARALARRFRVPVTWVPGGHLCPWEHPDAFAAALR